MGVVKQHVPVVVVVDMIDCSVDTHHCTVDTVELFHDYFFYVSVERLSSKIPYHTLLQRQEPYSLQRPLKRSFKRNKVIVKGVDDQWDVDLMDMTKFAKYNNGYNFILVVIDIFSKYVWLRPLKDKKGESVSKALKDVLAEGRVT
jgi:hypothetical protein